MLPRLLFVLKQRQGYWGSYDLSSGLLNSVRFIVAMLVDNGIPAKMVQVVDANGIDAEIKAYNPTNVIIEAFWAPPTKFDVLKKIYPHVTFSVRNHSEIPFLANEGMAMDWLYGYLSRGMEVMSNSPRAVSDTKAIALAYGNYQSLISYAPNYYPIPPPPRRLTPRPPIEVDTVNIGCFGAIRPLKNQLEQAVAAIRFAYYLGKKLNFHINSMRVEGSGEQIVKNLVALFANAKRTTLVQHPWLSHDDFLTLLGTMDFALQCSFSETFNIVSADAVSMAVSVTASSEVEWLGSYGQCDPNNSLSIESNLLSANRQIHHSPTNNRLIWQWRDLYNYSQASQAWWLQRFGP